MKNITLSKGKIAIVDDTDFEWLSKWKWYFNQAGYAARLDGKTKKTIYMHRAILNTPEKMYSDHVNGDKLDNRRNNLRICTNSQNMMNRGIQANNTTGAKGVHINAGRFRAKIQIDRQVIHLGYFDTLQEAAQAYNNAAKKIHKYFAKENI